MSAAKLEWRMPGRCMMAPAWSPHALQAIHRCSQYHHMQSGCSLCCSPTSHVLLKGGARAPGGATSSAPHPAQGPRTSSSERPQPSQPAPGRAHAGTSTAAQAAKHAKPGHVPPRPSTSALGNDGAAAAPGKKLACKKQEARTTTCMPSKSAQLADEQTERQQENGMSVACAPQALEPEGRSAPSKPSR